MTRTLSTIRASCRPSGAAPNNSFKPNALRYTKHMADKACHVFGSTTHVGLTQALGRMTRIGATGLLLVLVACSQSPPPPVDLSHTDRGVLAGCPVLPGVDSVAVTRQDGVDFRLCKYTHTQTGRVLFDVYVGEHPQSHDRLRYAATTRANGKDLIWFYTPTGGWGRPRTWYTYLPTGSPRGTVMVVNFTTHRRGQFEAVSDLVAHLQPSL